MLKVLLPKDIDLSKVDICSQDETRIGQQGSLSRIWLNVGAALGSTATTISQHTLVPLPPYAPELNAMEQIWQWIKNHFLSNQCYGVYEDIVANACYAWNQLSKNVNLVKSIMYRE
ncbi:transposase [Candidatus Tisiphia endosymbiont of Ptychoptera albimana]|uniref:transposase n=1 Tax=Candidatus Tisiphia endosymbiont of Ptychoptera albimana TaxID=3066260 RepID=UPI00312CBEEC